MGSTNGVLLPIPELTESADGPKAVSDLSNAIEDYFFDRIISPAQTTAGIVRLLPYHWGSGTSLPTATMGAKAGDLYLHTGLACTMRCITPGNTAGTNIWRQAENAIVATQAARDAISTNYSALLYEGFQVQVQTVVGPPLVLAGKFRWINNAWIRAAVALPRVSVRRTTVQSIPGTTGAAIAFDTASTRSTSGMWAAGSATRLVAPETAEYDLTALVPVAVSANAGGLALSCRINGGAPATAIGMDARASNVWYESDLSATLPGLELTAADYVEIWLIHNTDASRNISIGARATLELVRR